MVSPSICGTFLTNKRSLVAFTWTISTILTLFAFLTAIALTIQIHSHYRKLHRYYETDEWQQNYDYDYADCGGGEGGEGEEGGGEDCDKDRQGSQDYQRQQEAFLLLSTMSAKSMTFVAVYTMLLAVGLSLYGSTAIVGFTSLRGDYIAPCFSSENDKFKIGIFGGAIVLFANLLLVCAVILGEVRVEDYSNYYDDNNNDGQEEKEPYQVERIATVLAVTCMFLSALYTIFGVLLFLCYASEENLSDGVDRTRHDGASGHPKPLVSVTAADQRHMDAPGFITMENSSQGTSA